jgi:hypothetical protein
MRLQTGGNSRSRIDRPSLGATQAMAKKKPDKTSELAVIIPVGQIEQRILLIRGQRVILASDLARMYCVPVRVLNQAVRRNADRFPGDFVFQLSREETDALSRSQFVTLNDGPVSKPKSARLSRGTNLKYLPYAFTEHGVIMAANLLRSSRAVKVSVFVVRAFVKLREMLSTHRELAVKLNELETKLQKHDHQIVALIDAIRSLMRAPPSRPESRIGFQTELAQPKR